MRSSVQRWLSNQQHRTDARKKVLTMKVQLVILVGAAILAGVSSLEFKDCGRNKQFITCLPEIKVIGPVLKASNQWIFCVFQARRLANSRTSKSSTVMNPKMRASWSATQRHRSIWIWHWVNIALRKKKSRFQYILTRKKDPKHSRYFRMFGNNSVTFGLGLWRVVAIASFHFFWIVANVGVVVVPWMLSKTVIETISIWPMCVHTQTTSNRLRYRSTQNRPAHCEWFTLQPTNWASG